jgi:hypothetical protein
MLNSNMEVPSKRTLWAEPKVEQLLSVPFISEFIFRSPQIIDPTQKESVDFAFVHKQRSILVSQKAQEEPEKRTVEKNRLWVLKNAKNALSQLRGAIHSPKDKTIWCDHPRRGRVEFAGGLPQALHGIVVIESLHAVDLRAEADKLPLVVSGVPITYLSLGDFVNVALELRTIPELLEYLNARRTLPKASLYRIGDELRLFELYLLNGGTLNGCLGHRDAERAVETHSDRLQETLARASEYHYYSGLLEHVAECLATRNPRYAEGLPQRILGAFDPSDNRQNYMVLQEVIANMRLRERAELGSGLHGTIDKLADQPKGFIFCTARIDSWPEWVFVLAASKNWERPTLIEKMELLVRGAMAFYGKTECLFILDRDGGGFEVGKAGQDVELGPQDQRIGEHFFGKLRVASTEISGF